jgi:hypothetical protein
MSSGESNKRKRTDGVEEELPQQRAKSSTAVSLSSIRFIPRHKRLSKFKKLNARINSVDSKIQNLTRNSSSSDGIDFNLIPYLAREYSGSAARVHICLPKSSVDEISG